MRRLFHLADTLEWQRFQDAGDQAWAPASLAREGFVHLSFAEQLAGTLDAHFADRRTLVLLEVEARALGSELRLERSRAGLLFPHVYRALWRTELVGVWRLARAGGWNLPRLAAERTADEPPGSASSGDQSP